MKVFISSTVVDLQDLRSEIRDYLIQRGLSVALSESPESAFKVGTSPKVVQACLDNVSDSDIVLLVLSNRYGQSLPEHGGKSVTQLEYEHALALGKRTHVAVREELWHEYERWIRSGRRTDALIRSDDDKELLLRWCDRLFDGPLSERTHRDTFFTVVDLKKLLRKRLRDVMAGGAAKKSIPLMSIRFGLGSGRSDDRLTVRFCVENFGTSPAFDVVLSSASVVPIINLGNFAIDRKQEGDLTYKLAPEQYRRDLQNFPIVDTLRLDFADAERRKYSTAYRWECWLNDNARDNVEYLGLTQVMSKPGGN